MKIGIIGLGLIGGSLAIDLRKLGHYIIGVSSANTIAKANDRSVIDRGDVCASILQHAELVVICTPIAAIIPTIEGIIPHLSSQTVVTDVGSVKGSIVPAATDLWPNFVGAHPMAGKAESGLDVATEGLFRDRPFVVTPEDRTLPTAISLVEDVFSQLGCRLYRATPEAHDRAVALISHLPVMISSALIATCTSEEDTLVLKLAQNLASSGFQDTSRVGGGNPQLGKMMAEYNQNAILRSLYRYRDRLDETIAAVEEGNWQQIEWLLQHTQSARSNFLPK
jgi:arogenate dehydrogenase (NADP+)